MADKWGQCAHIAETILVPADIGTSDAKIPYRRTVDNKREMVSVVVWQYSTEENS
jgi:hypothetical protein